MLLTLVLTTLAFVTILYLVSLYLRDASIMDIFWGIGFILIAAQSLYIGFYNNMGIALPKLVATGLVIIWGIRLSAHILGRHRGEDPRYARWRQEWGSSYPLRSYLQIFVLQGALMLIISSAIWIVNFTQITAFDARMLWIGCGIWALGFLFESIADLQLSWFRSHPANRGKLLMSGLWSLSRHPNYFGEALQWWGLGVLALSAGLTWWQALLGPVVITVLVRFISGVPLLEERMRRNPHYAQYAARTNAFIPWLRR